MYRALALIAIAIIAVNAQSCVMANTTSNPCGFRDDYTFIVPPNENASFLLDIYDAQIRSPISDLYLANKECATIFKRVVCKQLFRQCSSGAFVFPVAACRSECLDLRHCLLTLFGEQAAALAPNCSSVTSIGIGDATIDDYADENCNNETVTPKPSDCQYPTLYNPDHEEGFVEMCALGCPKRYINDASGTERILMFVFVPTSIILGLIAVIISTKVALKRGFPLTLHCLIMWYVFLNSLGYFPSLFLNSEELLCKNEAVYVRRQDSPFCTFQGLWMYHFLTLSDYAFVSWVAGMVYMFIAQSKPKLFGHFVFVAAPWVVQICVDLYLGVSDYFGPNHFVSTNCVT